VHLIEISNLNIHLFKLVVFGCLMGIFRFFYFVNEKNVQ
jgi:hypothetical protein